MTPTDEERRQMSRSRYWAIRGIGESRPPAKKRWHDGLSDVPASSLEWHDSGGSRRERDRALKIDRDDRRGGGGWDHQRDDATRRTSRRVEGGRCGAGLFAAGLGRPHVSPPRPCRPGRGDSMVPESVYRRVEGGKTVGPVERRRGSGKTGGSISCRRGY